MRSKVLSTAAEVGDRHRVVQKGDGMARCTIGGKVRLTVADVLIQLRINDGVFGFIIIRITLPPCLRCTVAGLR